MSTVPVPVIDNPEGLEHDDDGNEVDDKDSAIGSDVSVYTETLRSSLLESIRENGRSYHRYHDGSYALPDDDREQERLDMQHEMFLRTFNHKLILAPLGNQPIHHVLDLGTGTGLWAIQFADENPEANVIGTDLSPMQPSMVPVNYGPRLFRQAFDALRPGGWIEFQDASMPIRADDGTMDGTAWADWVDKFMDAMQKLGRDSAAPEKYAQWARDAGFINVTRVDFKWPQNGWPKNPALKELGRWHLINTLDGLHGFTVRPFTAVLGMSVEEVELLLMNVRKDIANRRIHSYWPIIVVYGQKPAVGSPQ
ncbi:hypothetical protein LTR24_007414 [Lithohypha guttulata]|uniref:Methyltransferase n=1 Tax=Lithohypha guttulata TaxID=1690604 RepID=A0ABR0K3H0_9EURO|nr:hypothetical protein LTR24_007414 [Lithohypha guttulata]